VNNIVTKKGEKGNNLRVAGSQRAIRQLRVTTRTRRPSLVSPIPSSGPLLLLSHTHSENHKPIDDNTNKPMGDKSNNDNNLPMGAGDSSEPRSSNSTPPIVQQVTTNRKEIAEKEDNATMEGEDSSSSIDFIVDRPILQKPR